MKTYINLNIKIMSKNKKRFSRRNRAEIGKKHTFDHKISNPNAGFPKPEAEDSAQTSKDFLNPIKKDLRLFLIIAGIIMTVTTALYIMSVSADIKIFNINI